MKAIKNIVLCIALLVPCLAQTTITPKKVYRFAKGISAVGGSALCAGYLIYGLGMLLPGARLIKSRTGHMNKIQKIGGGFAVIGIPLYLIGIVSEQVSKYFIENKDDIEEYC